MNHVYRIVFNSVLGLWQVVGEHARRRGKFGSATRKRWPAHVSLQKNLIALALFSGLPALALAASITGSGDIVPTLPAGPLTDWNVYDVLHIGLQGIGTLSVKDGAKLFSYTSRIGTERGSEGSVTIAGAGSSWTHAGHLIVGQAGQGALSVEDGGHVSNDFAVIGEQADSFGGVRITGGSSWQTSALSVGLLGQGELMVDGGSQVSSSLPGFIGSGAGSEGIVTISGAGSRWSLSSAGNDGRLQVGDSGQGTLNILDGGKVTSQSGAIGTQWGSNGRVTITGPGSQWISGQKLEVGSQGKGMLEILDGGKLQSQKSDVGGHATGQGAVRVSGLGSSWEAGEIVSVGQGGTGVLTVEDNGKVSSKVISIGANPHSKGEVVVRTGARLETSDDGISVGSAQGTGTLRIEKAGQVVSAGNSLVGALDGVGHVSVTDAGSLWKAENVVIGFANQNAGSASTLTLSNGGTLETESLMLASFVDDAGVLNIGARANETASSAGRVNTSQIVLGSGKATVNFNHTDAAYNFDAKLKSEPASQGSHQINQLAGVTYLTADNVKFQGVTNVLAGKLVVADRIKGSAQVTGGTLQFGEGNVGRQSELSALSVSGADSTLAMTEAATLKVVGNMAMADHAVLALVASDQPLAAVLADSLTLGQGVRMNLSGISEVSQLDKVLIATNNGITGDFGSVHVGGFNGTVDYLTLNTRKSADNKQYLASYGLSWTAGNNLAHGTFTLTNQTDSFDVGVVLADRAANPTTAWDGKTLIKAGAGTLILSADNTYSGGTTIAEGALQLGNGGNTGSIVGDVLNNGALAFNRRDTLRFDGVVSGTGKLIQMGDGTTVLNGDNQYRGGTVLASGVLQVAKNVNLGDSSGGLTFTGGTLKTTASFDTDRSVALLQTGQFEVADGTVLGLTGQVHGDGDVFKTGTGTLRLDNVTNAYGNTRIQEGTLIGNAATLSGHIANAGTLVFDQATDANYAGNIGGLGGVSGNVIKQGAGSLTLTGLSSQDWALQEGVLITAAERFSGNADIAATGSLQLDQKNDATYVGSLSGMGSFVKRGDGALLMQKDSSAFTGQTQIETGKLIVNGQLGGSMHVQTGGVLAGAGTVGSGTGSTIVVASGGTLSPGNSIGTLTVDGDLNLQQGARFEVEVNPASKEADLVHVTGSTQLDGGSVAHIGATGHYQLRSTYTILSTEKGLNGAFDDVTSDFAFLDPTLLYDYANGTVDLSLTRKNKEFASVALTRNQKATARGIDSIGFDAGHTVYDAFVQLPDNHNMIRSSLDQLSGEIHASMKSALIEESHLVRDAVTDRLRAAFGGIAASSSPVMAYEEGQMRLSNPATQKGTVWAQSFGEWGRTDSDGNAAALRRSVGGLLIGADAQAFETWRFGVLAGYSRTSADVNDRSASGNSDNYHLGAYAGTRWALPKGSLSLRTGLAHTWHQIDTSRSVDMPGLNSKLKDHYRAGTFQAFADVGYRIDLPSASLEPFVGVAYNRLHSSGFSEHGGEAALHGRSQNTNTTFTTLGLRATTALNIGGIEASVRGSLGWRHALGDTTALSSHAFSAGNTFTVAGVPLAKNAALIEAGVDMAITPSSSFGLTYDGQITGSARQHSVKANLNIHF